MPEQKKGYWSKPLPHWYISGVFWVLGGMYSVLAVAMYGVRTNGRYFVVWIFAAVCFALALYFGIIGIIRAKKNSDSNAMRGKK